MQHNHHQHQQHQPTHSLQPHHRKPHRHLPSRNLPSPLTRNHNPKQRLNHTHRRKQKQLTLPLLQRSRKLKLTNQPKHNQMRIRKNSSHNRQAQTLQNTILTRQKQTRLPTPLQQRSRTLQRKRNTTRLHHHQPRQPHSSPRPMPTITNTQHTLLRQMLHTQPNLQHPKHLPQYTHTQVNQKRTTPIPHPQHHTNSQQLQPHLLLNSLNARLRQQQQQRNPTN